MSRCSGSTVAMTRAEAGRRVLAIEPSVPRTEREQRVLGVAGEVRGTRAGRRDGEPVDAGRAERGGEAPQPVRTAGPSGSDGRRGRRAGRPGCRARHASSMPARLKTTAVPLLASQASTSSSSSDSRRRRSNPRELNSAQGRRHRRRRPDRLQPAVPSRERILARSGPPDRAAAARDRAGPEGARGCGRWSSTTAPSRRWPASRSVRTRRRSSTVCNLALLVGAARAVRAWSAATCSRRTARSSPRRAGPSTTSRRTTYASA